MVAAPYPALFAMHAVCACIARPRPPRGVTEPQIVMGFHIFYSDDCSRCFMLWRRTEESGISNKLMLLRSACAAGSRLDGCCSIDFGFGQTRLRKTNFSHRSISLEKREQTDDFGQKIPSPHRPRPSVHHPEAALCRFYLLTASAVPSAPRSFLRSFVGSSDGGSDGVISEQSPSIKLIMVTAGWPMTTTTTTKRCRTGRRWLYR